MPAEDLAVVAEVHTPAVVAMGVADTGNRSS
jgi:hypothetical protein